MHSFNLSTLACLALILFIWKLNCIEVLMEDGTYQNFNTPKFIGNKSPIIKNNIRSYLSKIYDKNIQSCKTTDGIEKLNNTIAIIAPFGGCATERHIELAQNAGAIAVLIVTTQVWRNCNVKDFQSEHFNNQINAVCISTKDYGILLKMMNKTSVFVIFNEDQNEYDTKLNKHLINFGTIIFFIFYILIAIASVVQFYRCFKIEGPKFNIRKLLTGMNIYCSIVNAIVVIDLNGYRGWFISLQYLTTYHYYFSTGTLFQFIIFSFYFARVLSIASKKYKDLINYLNIFITSLFLIFFSVLIVVLSVYGYTWSLNARTGDAIVISILTMHGSVALFCLCSSALLFAKLNIYVNIGTGRVIRAKRRKKYIKFLIILIVVFFIKLLGLAVTACINFNSILDDIQVYFMIYFLLNLDLVAWLVVVLITFPPKRKEENPNAHVVKIKKDGEDESESQDSSNGNNVGMSSVKNRSGEETSSSYFIIDPLQDGRNDSNLSAN